MAGMKKLLSILPFLALAFAGICFSASDVFAAPSKKVSKSVPAADDDKDDVFEDVEENLPGENYNAAWPKTTKLEEKLPAKTIQEGPKEWIYETRHFRFVSDAPIRIKAIKQIAWVFEGTYAANLALPLNAPCNHYQTASEGKFQSRFYKELSDFKSGGAPDSSAGYYAGANMKTGVTHVPFASLELEKRGDKYDVGKKINQRTLVHEITHHMTINDSRLPIWFAEGYAEYVASAPYNNGKITFNRNKKNLKELSDYLLRRLGSKNIKAPMSLKDFLDQDPAAFMSGNMQFNYAMSLMFFYYLCHCEGKNGEAVKTLARALRENQAAGEALDKIRKGRSWTKFQDDVAKEIGKILKITITFPKED